MQQQPPWEQLAQSFAASRHVSADKLIEWPVQLRMTGDFQGKRILDVGCGTGDKARFYAEHGAAYVLGIDSCGGFARQWTEHAGCRNLQLVQAGFEEIAFTSQLTEKEFDIVVCFQALMYACDISSTVKNLAALLVPGGTFTISVPHPFRFAILKNEIEGWPHGLAYQKTQSYRYPSPWKADVLLEHATPRISDYLNAFAGAGLLVRGCEEPAVTDEFREHSPEKAAWMDRYVGTMVFQCERT